MKLTQFIYSNLIFHAIEQYSNTKNSIQNPNKIKIQILIEEMSECLEWQSF